ncbi:hypothetical protein [Streptomyces narbonensis]
MPSSTPAPCRHDRRISCAAGAGARLAALAAAVLLAASTAALLTPRPEAGPHAAPATALDVAAARAADPVPVLVRTPGERWSDTARVDFTAWPARGARTGDTALLSRALDAWARGTGDRIPRRTGGRAGARAGDVTALRVTVTPDTPATPPSAPARLLFAGQVDASAVVLLHDGGRLVRYAEPLTGQGGAALELARADDADVTTGAAVAVSRTPLGARFLFAPWIDESAVRDLLRPDVPARPLAVSDGGVTDPVPPAPGDCGRLPGTAGTVLHPDRREPLLPAGGSRGPQPRAPHVDPATGDRSPRAAAARGDFGGGPRRMGPFGLRAAGPAGHRRACREPVGVRPADPAGARRTRHVDVHPGRELGRPRPCDGGVGGAGAHAPGRRRYGRRARRPRAPAACSRFGQHVLAGTYWTAPSGARYYLAAGSRALTTVTARGPVSATVRGRVLAVRTNAAGPVRLTGRLPGTADLRGWGETEEGGAEGS